MSTQNRGAAVSLPAGGELDSVAPPSEGVRGVMVTKTGSGAIVVSANSERKNGISVLNANQLAGNHTFIFLLTLISLQRKCPHSHRGSGGFSGFSDRAPSVSSRR